MPSMTAEWTPELELLQAIAATTWRDTRPDFMPDYPHQYITRNRFPVTFELISNAISEHGYWGAFGGHAYRYVNIQDFKYWAFQIVLNRERLLAGPNA